MPSNAATLGEHLRKKRIELRLFQKDLAEIFNVSKSCISYWENNISEPQIQYYSPIFAFLGYCAFELEISTFAGKIKTYRYFNGITQKQFAKRMILDPATVGRWENGKEQGAKKELVEVFLSNFILVVNQGLLKDLNSG